jgi:hypothetical protein
LAFFLLVGTKRLIVKNHTDYKSLSHGFKINEAGCTGIFTFLKKPLVRAIILLETSPVEQAPDILL